MRAPLVVWLLLVSLVGVSLASQAEVQDQAHRVGGMFRGRGVPMEQQKAWVPKPPDEENLDLEEFPSAEPENRAAVMADQPVQSAAPPARMASRSRNYNPMPQLSPPELDESSSGGPVREMGGAPEMNEQLDTGGYPAALHAAGIVGFSDNIDAGRGRGGGSLPGFYTPRIYPSGQAVGASSDGGQMFSDPGVFGWDLNFRSNEDPQTPDQGRPISKYMGRRYAPDAEPASPRNLWVRRDGDDVEEEPDMYPFVRSPQNIMMHEGAAAYYANGAPGVPFYNENSPWHPQHPANPLNPNQDPRNPLSRFHPDNALNPMAPKDPYSPFYYRNPASPYYPYNSQNLWTAGAAGLGPQANPQMSGYSARGGLMGQMGGMMGQMQMGPAPMADPRLSAYQQYMPAPQQAPQFAAPQVLSSVVHTLLAQPAQVTAGVQQVMGTPVGVSAMVPPGIQGDAFYGPLPSEEGSQPMPAGYGLPGNFPFVG